MFLHILCDGSWKVEWQLCVLQCVSWVDDVTSVQFLCGWCGREITANCKGNLIGKGVVVGSKVYIYLSVYLSVFSISHVYHLWCNIDHFWSFVARVYIHSQKSRIVGMLPEHHTCTCTYRKALLSSCSCWRARSKLPN